MQLVGRDAFKAPEQEWMIREETILIESRSAEVKKVAGTEPESSKWRVLFGDVVCEGTERMVRVEAKIYIFAAEWRESPSAN